VEQRLRALCDAAAFVARPRSKRFSNGRGFGCSDRRSETQSVLLGPSPKGKIPRLRDRWRYYGSPGGSPSRMHRQYVCEARCAIYYGSPGGSPSRMHHQYDGIWLCECTGFITAHREVRPPECTTNMCAKHGIYYGSPGGSPSRMHHQYVCEARDLLRLTGRFALPNAPPICVRSTGFITAHREVQCTTDMCAKHGMNAPPICVRSTGGRGSCRAACSAQRSHSI
jgi:hypothetical protein